MSDDPRDLGGGIAGPGGPHDRSGVVIDARNALLVANLMVSAIDRQPDSDPGELLVATQVTGRINGTDTHHDLLLVLNADGVAAFVSELVGLVNRMAAHDPGGAQAVVELIEARLEALP